MATVFNDKIFADLAFQQVVDVLSPIMAFSTDISDAAKAKGDSVTVSLFGNVTTTTFTQASDVMEQTGGTVSAITVTLDKRKITPVDLTHQQLIDSSNANKMEEFAKQMAASMASTVLADIFSVFTVTNFGAPVTTSSAAFDLNAVNSLGALLDTRKCPAIGRSLISTNTVKSYLRMDSRILYAMYRGNDRAISTGTVGPIMDFEESYFTSVLPSNSVSLIGVACGKAGVAVAFRNIGDVLPEQEYDAIETVSDSKSGLTMLYTRHWSRAQGKWFLNFHSLYGYSKAVTLQVALACTATT